MGGQALGAVGVISPAAAGAGERPFAAAGPAGEPCRSTTSGMTNPRLAIECGAEPGTSHTPTTGPAAASESAPTSLETTIQRFGASGRLDSRGVEAAKARGGAAGAEH